jgi:uncharacterized RmlC-like cupin family protein
MSDQQAAGEHVDVRVVGPDARDSNTGQTPGGLHRFEAVSNRLTGSQKMWMGYAVLDPGGKTGVHHHGESETAIYILSGVTRWWVGDRLDDVREARAGDFVYIPAGIVHWEQNASDTEPRRRRSWWRSTTTRSRPRIRIDPSVPIELSCPGGNRDLHYRQVPGPTPGCRRVA